MRMLLNVVSRVGQAIGDRRRSLLRGEARRVTWDQERSDAVVRALGG